MLEQMPDDLLNDPLNTHQYTMLRSSTSDGEFIISGGKGGEMVTKKTEKSVESNVVVYKGKKMKMKVGSLLYPNISLKTPSKNAVDKWAKEFLLKTVHSGINKLVSNETSLEFYECEV